MTRKVIDQDLISELLEQMGEDPTREGLIDTPRRVSEAWAFWTSGYSQDPQGVLRSFEEDASKYDEMVFQGSIPCFSMCEHHLAPFFGVAHIGYIPGNKIVGLSKLARVTEVFSRRLQIQERLTNQIADALLQSLNPLGVGVVLQCRHTCMESRGVQKIGTLTTTSALRGSIKSHSDARSEFMQFVNTESRRSNIL